MSARVEKLVEFNQRLHDIADSMMGESIHLKEAKDYIVTFALAKSYKTHNSVMILCSDYHGQDAAVLVRTIFDLMVNVKYILKEDTELRIERYMAFDWIMRKRMFDKAKDMKGFDKQIAKNREMDQSDSPEKVAEEAAKAEARFNFGRTISWSGKSIADLAKDADLESTYTTVFVLQSNLTHSNSRSMMEYVTDNGDSIDFNIEKDPKWVEESLVSGFDFFLRLVEIFNNNFSLSYDEQLQKLTDDYIEEIAK